MLKIDDRNRKIQDKVKFNIKLGRFRDVKLLSLLCKMLHSIAASIMICLRHYIIKMSFSNASADLSQHFIYGAVFLTLHFLHN
jgi:hypothetical protein